MPDLYILMLLEAPDVPFWPEEESLFSKLQYQIGTPTPQDYPEARGLFYPASAGPRVRLHLVRFHYAWVAEQSLRPLIPKPSLVTTLLRTTPENIGAFACHYLQWLAATETAPVQIKKLVNIVRNIDRESWIMLMRNALFRHLYAADYLSDFLYDHWTMDEPTLRAVLDAMASGSNMHRLDRPDVVRYIFSLHTSVDHETILRSFPRVMKELEKGSQYIYETNLHASTATVRRVMKTLRRRRLWSLVRAVFYGTIMMSLFNRWSYHPDQLTFKMSGLSLMTTETRLRMKDSSVIERPTSLPAEFCILKVDAFFR